MASFHPELQAELAFGVTQCRDVSASDLMENFWSFIANDEDWDAANKDIVDQARIYTQEDYPAMDELEAVVSYEVAYQKAMWGQDFEAAVSEARTIITKLTSPDLRGYRALWHYLAGGSFAETFIYVR